MPEAIWITFAFGLGLLVKLVGLPPLVGYLAAGFVLSGIAEATGVVIEETDVLQHIAQRDPHQARSGRSGPPQRPVIVRVQVNGEALFEAGGPQFFQHRGEQIAERFGRLPAPAFRALLAGQGQQLVQVVGEPQHRLPGLRPGVGGALTLERDGTRHVLSKGQGIEIAPGTPHQALNEGDADAVFLVISSPRAQTDRQPA